MTSFMSSSPFGLICFNSLFVGMCFAMLRSDLAIDRVYRCFNSLFVGMCFAITVFRLKVQVEGTRFNSLFVGMCFAIVG